MIIEKIEALCPNVLLVEKSASSYAQEYLLAKEISLVLDVKRPLLKRIARCTGALVCPSIDNLSTTQLGHCELFRLEKVSEEHEMANQFNKKPSKTLLFFEGCATLPKMKVKRLISVPEKMQADDTVSVPNSYSTSSFDAIVNASAQNDVSLSFSPAQGGRESLSEKCNQSHFFPSSGGSILDSDNDDLSPGVGLDMDPELFRDSKLSTMLPSDVRDFPRSELQETVAEEESRPGGIQELVKSENFAEDGACSKYFSGTDKHQSILVSFSSRCVLKGTVCERARLLRIKFYGSFDKRLGRYLRDDLFDQASCCRSCSEPADAHVICYTQQQRNLTINVSRFSSRKIWMRHRCLKFDNMVAFFRYSPIDILSVHVPPSTLEFSGNIQHEWTRKEAAELMVKMEMLYSEVSDSLDSIEQKIDSANDLQNHIMELKEQMQKEINDNNGLLQPAVMETSQSGLEAVDISELNRQWCSLLSSLYASDQQLHSLDTILRKEPLKNYVHSEKNSVLSNSEPVVPKDLELVVYDQKIEEGMQSDGNIASPASALSERIDFAWTCTDLLTLKVQTPEAFQEDEVHNLPLSKDEWVTDKSIEIGGGWSFSHKSKEEDSSSASSFSPWQSFGSLDLDYIRHGSSGSEDASSSADAAYTETKRKHRTRDPL
ncbi:hypothetical protein GQ457_18G022830 [Hibiscus cannabinus]